MLICPTSCPKGIQRTTAKKNLPGQLVHTHIPLLTNAPCILSVGPPSLCTQHKHLLPKCCFSPVPFAPKALWGSCVHFLLWSRTNPRIFQNKVFLQCGVGFWRGLYDLAVEMPLSSHLLEYLLPPCEPAVLKMRFVPLHHAPDLLPMPIPTFIHHFLLQASLCSKPCPHRVGYSHGIWKNQLTTARLVSPSAYLSDGHKHKFCTQAD